MKQCYLMAIKLANVDSMYNLGWYYQCVEKNYPLMKQYYLMAIEKGDSDAMNNLGKYYEYELMEKYYLMAIEKGDSNAMNNLGYHYSHEENNYELTKKYATVNPNDLKEIQTELVAGETITTERISYIKGEVGQTVTVKTPTQDTLDVGETFIKKYDKKIDKVQNASNDMGSSFMVYNAYYII